MDSPQEPIQELLDLERLRAALTSGLAIVTVDFPTKAHVFHPDPGACPGIRVGWFTQKVIDNAGRNGGYFLVSDESTARTRWSDLTICQRCS